MYVILGGGNVLSSDDILMIINLKRCNFVVPEGLKIEEDPEGMIPRTLVITVDGRGIYTNSMTSTILNRIRKWRKGENV
ncbi:MAG: hypothetical protein NZ900_02365 [Synergistetes bacterium]|nr:hypothetical protein [Synergistota bacterium]MDW8191773.1 hypothetical protein [Synergistota bacterium]